MKDLPDDLQEATRSAIAFLLGMRRENDEGEVVFRIGLHDLGGRGKGKKLGPWGAAKEIVAFYIGGMGDYYKEMLSGFGFAKECEEVDRIYKDPKTRAQATEAVPMAMVENASVRWSR